MTARMRAMHLGAFLTPFLAAGAARADLLSRWSFDGDFLDSEAAGNHGAFVGNPSPVFVEGRDGTANGAISFDGVDDYVSVPQGTGLPIHGQPAFTITLWVKGIAQVDKRVFSEGSTTSDTPLFNIGTDSSDIATNTGVADIYIRSDADAAVIDHRKSVRPAFDDTWHHLAWVDDNGTASLYVDGLLASTDFNYARPALTTDTTTFGAILRAAAGSFFAGAIDDARIFNHALSEAEVHTVIESPSCPVDGDSTCSNLQVVGPSDNGAGSYTLTAAGADDSGDTDLLYTFTADNGEGVVLTKGPQLSNTTTFPLTAGTWTLSSAVDDTLFCFDSRAEDTCTQTIEVVPPPRLLISHWSFDGDLLDPVSGNDGSFVGKESPPFRPGYDCTVDGALQFDGAADHVVAAQTRDLPISREEAFSVVLWVKGPPQGDRRVFSEGSTTSDSPLFNIGTDNTGATGAVDIFIRDDADAAIVSHVHSSGVAFDGEWHHIAYTDDDGTAKLYIDGVLDAASFNYTRSPLTLNTTTIGGILRAAPCCWFNGRIDDVRLYNFALDAAEVAGIFGSGPGDCCPEVGDTHCQGLTVTGPAGGGPGEYTAQASAADDSGDDITYTFTASNGIDAPMVTGPQGAASAAFTIGGAPGSTTVWTFTVEVDDDPTCPDVSGDAVCSAEKTVIVCPDQGDTHCQGLVITGPAGGGPGAYLAEASAADDSGDDIQYTFTASNGVDTPVVIGPQPGASASFDLGIAAWTVRVAVDDDPACGDAAPDASCEETVVVEEPRVGPFTRGNSNADRRVDLADVVFILNWLFRGGPEPPCIAAANASSTDSIDIASAIYILGFLFLAGPPPQAPFPDCGLSTNPFDVALGCVSFPPCE